MAGKIPKRCRRTADFKVRMVRDALREADTLSAVASRHGIHPNQGRGWRRLFLEGGQAALRNGAKQASEHEATIRDLHTKIDELMMEKDFFVEHWANEPCRAGSLSSEDPLGMTRQCHLLGIGRSAA